MHVIDLRDRLPDPPPLVSYRKKDGSTGRRRRYRVVEGEVIKRPRESIDTIVLHQAACLFGKDHESRALRVPADMLIYRDQRIVLPKPLTWYANHANRYNARSLGIEVEGVYLGAPRSKERRRTPVTAELLEAIEYGIPLLVELALNEGIVLKHYRAHRQSSRTRRGDPGYELWPTMARACESAGLTCDMSETVGSGRPIPAVWDERAHAQY